MSNSKVNLPQTNFPMRGNLPQNEPNYLDLWKKIDLYKKIRQRNRIHYRQCVGCGRWRNGRNNRYTIKIQSFPSSVTIYPIASW